jgi:rRNA-processing protein FCF1
MDNKKFEKQKISNIVEELEITKFENLEKDPELPIIFDTNFLFVTFQFNVDVIEELKKKFGNKFKLYIYKGSISELSNLENKKTKNKQFIPLIAKMLKLYNFKIINSDIDYIDKQILENIDKKSIIATNDKILKKLIKEKGGKVLYLRQKNFLKLCEIFH